MAKAGAPPKFNEAHINWVFWKIAASEPMGRKQIVKETGLGEGSIRTILEKLEEYGLITSARSGRALTDNGKKVAQKLKQLIRMKPAGALEMTKNLNNFIVLVKGRGDLVKSGMAQRDAAIASGKGGATTLIVKKGEFIMPGIDSSINMSKEYPDDVEKLKDLFDPEEADVLVIGSEKKITASEEAAWIAASTLLS